MRPTARLHPRRHAAAWWVRLLLVLVLVGDLVGSPLHRHHHDSGVDGTAVLADAAHQATAFQPHAEDDDGDPSVFHATTTLRAQAPAAAYEAGTDQQAMVAWLPASLELLNVAQPSSGSVYLPGDRRPPPRPIPLSRPPEGRAPPVRA